MRTDSFVVLSAQSSKTAEKPHTPLGSLGLLPQSQVRPPSNVCKFLRNWSLPMRLQVAWHIPLVSKHTSASVSGEHLSPQTELYFLFSRKVAINCEASRMNQYQLNTVKT